MKRGKHKCHTDLEHLKWYKKGITLFFYIFKFFNWSYLIELVHKNNNRANKWLFFSFSGVLLDVSICGYNERKTLNRALIDFLFHVIPAIGAFGDFK